MDKIVHTVYLDADKNKAEKTCREIHKIAKRFIDVECTPIIKGFMNGRYLMKIFASGYEYDTILDNVKGKIFADDFT